MKQAVLQLHGNHHVLDEKTGKEVSFGLVRFANIDPCVNMALTLLSAEWPDDTAVFVMCYHSRQVLLLRHEQEAYLDHVLRRQQELLTIDGVEYPLLLGTSRKSFIGAALGLPVDERMEATGATCVVGIMKGAGIVRVHDVKPIARMCRMTDAILQAD